MNTYLRSLHHEVPFRRYAKAYQTYRFDNLKFQMIFLGYKQSTHDLSRYALATTY